MTTLHTFYTLVITQAFSLVGSRMTSIGLGLWLFIKTGDTTPLLLMSLFTELPGALAGSLAGVLVDRWDRRHVLILADAGQALGTVLLLAIFLSGHFENWYLYVVVFLRGIFDVFQQPAKSATITMLVPENHRERANAIEQLSFPLASVIAPVLTGMLYDRVGITGIVLIDLVTFGVAVIVVALVHIPRPKVTAESLAFTGGMWRELQGGFSFLWRRPALLGLVLYMTLTSFLLNGPLELSIPYLLTLTGSEAAMGGLMGLMGLATLTGAGLMAVWGGTRPRIHTLMIGFILTGAMFLVYGLARTLPLLGAGLFFLMLPLPISNVIFISILQVKTPPDMQGRIFAIFSQMGFLGATTSFLLVGPFVDRVVEPAVGGPGWTVVAPLVGSEPGSGIGLVLVLTGLIILATTLVSYALPMVRHLERDLPDYAGA